GKFMFFGDGGSVFSPLARSLDVTAHEYTHGVTENTARLKYQYQSGALSEAFSDIFACMIDRRNWQIGEDVTNRYPYFLRDLKDPHHGLSSLPASMDEYRNLPGTEDGDYGGVHINCSIPGRVAYLMAEGLSSEGYGASIGRDETEKIFYRALTQHLTPESDFSDCRRATIQSAEELHGADSAEVQAVETAWDVVDVLEEEDTGGEEGGTITPVKGPDNLLYIFYDEWGVPYLAMRLATGEEFYVSQTPVAVTRPVVVENGEAVLFVDAQNNLKFASLSPFSNYEAVIAADGRVRTIAGSSDGRYFAYTTNPEDNMLYLLDMEAMDKKEFTLFWPSDADVSSNSLLYIDNMDFDLTGNKIIFDALSELKFSDGEEGYSFWDIGILDIRSGRVEVLVPTMPEGYDIYTPSASAVRDWLIAFEKYHNPTGTRVSVIFNLITRQTSTIAEGTGSPVFNGDDTFLALEYDNEIVKVPIQVQSDGSAGSRFDDREVIGTGNSCFYPRFYRVGQRAVNPDIRVSDSMMTFGTVKIGYFITKTLMISNVGTYDLTIDDFQITDNRNFRHRGIHTSIAPGASISIQISFVPQNTGAKSATLSIFSDDPDALRTDVSLVGEGVQSYKSTGGSGSSGSSESVGGCFIHTLISPRR
ncbi:MAG: M4 family metallopeptidase, partial [bacterium]